MATIKNKKQAKAAVTRARKALGIIAEPLMDCPDPYEYPEGKAVRSLATILDDLKEYLK